MNKEVISRFTLILEVLSIQLNANEMNTQVTKFRLYLSEPVPALRYFGPHAE